MSGGSSGTRPGLEEAPREGRGVHAPGRKAGCVDLGQNNVLGAATRQDHEEALPEFRERSPGAWSGGEEAWVTAVQNPRRSNKRSAKVIL